VAKPAPVISRLPASLRAKVERSWQAKDFPAALELLEAARAKDSASGPVAAALAATLFEHALDVVNEMVPRCERALQLLDDAVRLGEPEAKLRGLRGKIERVRDGELAAARAADAQLEKLRRRRPEKLDYWDVMKLADATARTDPSRAASYYELAEAAAKKDVWRRDARNHRAACFAKAGAWDAAIPLLELAIGEVRSGGAADYSFIDEACYLLLLHAAERGDREQFLQRWRASFQPDEPGVPLGRYFKVFPFARPRRPPLLAAAQKLGLADIADHLTKLIATERTKR
jgi:hypothetical protein